MNPAYELALKEVNVAWKGGSFVLAMLARARIDPPPVALNNWGHPVEIGTIRPGDVVLADTQAGGVMSFYMRNLGAYIEGLTVAPDGTVKPQRFSKKKILAIARPPRPKPVEVTPLVAEFVRPGAMSKPVEVRKADPVQAAPQAFVPPPPKAPRFGLGWLFAVLVAGLTLAAAKFAEMF